MVVEVGPVVKMREETHRLAGSAEKGKTSKNDFQEVLSDCKSTRLDLSSVACFTLALPAGFMFFLWRQGLVLAVCLSTASAAASCAGDVSLQEDGSSAWKSAPPEHQALYSAHCNIPRISLTEWHTFDKSSPVIIPGASDNTFMDLVKKDRLLGKTLTLPDLVS